MKATRWVFASDTHGDMIDRGAESALKALCGFFKPTVRIHGGDMFDFRCLRRGASQEETLEDLKADIDAGHSLVDWFKPTHWLRGNHDERLIDGTDSHNPVLRRFSCLEWDKVAKALAGVKIYPYCKRKGVMKLGTLAFAHGFTSGMYAAKTMASIYGNVCCGHTHAIDAFSIPGLEPRVGRVVGCLCRLDMSYNRAQLNTLRQQHGFAYGFSYSNGLHRVFQAQEINGTWLFPTEFKELKVS